MVSKTLSEYGLGGPLLVRWWSTAAHVYKMPDITQEDQLLQTRCLQITVHRADCHHDVRHADLQEMAEKSETQTTAHKITFTLTLQVADSNCG